MVIRDMTCGGSTPVPMGDSGSGAVRLVDTFRGRSDDIG
jgi:hypothetical protein